MGGRWKRVAGDGNELLYHEITPVLSERKDTCVRVGRPPRPTSVFLSQGRFSRRSPRPRSPSDPTGGEGPISQMCTPALLFLPVAIF